MQDWVQDVDVAIVGLSAWRQTGPVDCGSRKLRPASKSKRYGEAGSHITITLADAAGGTDVLAVHAGLPPGVTHVFGGPSGNRSAINERAAQLRFLFSWFGIRRTVVQMIDPERLE